MKQFLKGCWDALKPILIVNLVLVALLGYFALIRVANYPSDARKAADKAKYTIDIGFVLFAYNVNSYSFTNGNLTFYDELRQKEFNFYNRAFSVKTNNL